MMLAYEMVLVPELEQVQKMSLGVKAEILL